MYSTYADLLSIELIRTHTKTDDAPFVTDEQLSLYRDAAFEAAEAYTKINFTPIRTINEPVRIRDRSGKIVLSHPVADIDVTIYGGSLHQPVTLIGRIGSNIIHFPFGHPDRFHTVGDCNKCGAEEPLMAVYKTGRKCNGRPVPAGVLVGILKYIAWNVANPGDVIMTTRNAQSVGNNGLSGSNDTALISGALDEWARYRKIVF